MLGMFDRTRAKLKGREPPQAMSDSRMHAARRDIFRPVGLFLRACVRVATFKSSLGAALSLVWGYVYAILQNLKFTTL